MEPRPLARCPAPRYPTRGEAAADPSLLAEALPERWLDDDVLAAVAAFAVVANTACAPAAAAEQAKATVAPVTAHGEGFATSGCDVVAPPVFLSEDEAIKVIKDEAAKRGLKLTAPTKPIAGVKLSLPMGKTPQRSAKPFAADLVDPQRGVAIEFVSSEDEYFYRTPDDSAGLPGTAALKYTYRTKDGAQALAQRVEAKATEKVFFGALYDPAGASQQMDKKRTENRELLRAQVVDFLDWLKAQGAL